MSIPEHNAEILDHGSIPHRCDLPSTKNRHIRKAGFLAGALVKCRKCGQVWVLRREGDMYGSWWAWNTVRP